VSLSAGSQVPETPTLESDRLMLRSTAVPESALLRRFYQFRIIEKRVLTGTAYLSGALFFLYSLYVAAEVVGRRFFSFYTGIADEIGGYVLAAGGSLAFAYTLLAGGHVRIDIIFGFLPKRMRPWLDAISMVTMSTFALTVAFYLFQMTFQSYRIGATGHSLIMMPQWLIQSVLSFGYLLLGVFAMSSSISHILEALMPRYWHDPARSTTVSAEKEH
jgi:TRAP-type mannitol/chloroaromatic compound transport system permease small subunit